MLLPQVCLAETECREETQEVDLEHSLLGYHGVYNNPLKVSSAGFACVLHSPRVERLPLVLYFQKPCTLVVPIKPQKVVSGCD